MTMAHSTVQELVQSLAALQTDVSLEVLSVHAQALRVDYSKGGIGGLSPHQLAKQLILGIKSITRQPISWPLPKQGQKYVAIHRLLRATLEWITGARIILEGSPKGNQVFVDLNRILLQRQMAPPSTRSPSPSARSRRKPGRQCSRESHTPSHLGPRSVTSSEARAACAASACGASR